MTLLLIGSQACKYHFRDFRSPNDIDLIASSEEDTRDWEPFLSKSIPNKSQFKLPGAGIVEVEYATGLPSSQRLIDLHISLLPKHMGSIKKDVIIASPISLLLVKRSHIIFDINWEKTFQDHQFLIEKLGLSSLDSNHLELMNLRVEEIAERRKLRKPNFRVSNEQFFNDNVQRFMPHDQLHQIIKFYENPIFQEIKRDPDLAEVDWNLFSSLPYDKQIANMAEEVLVLLFERVIIPNQIQHHEINHVIDHQRVFFKLMKGLCTNYLPYDFRLFGVDHFNEIIEKAKTQYTKVLPMVLKVVNEINCKRSGYASKN